MRETCESPPAPERSIANDGRGSLPARVRCVRACTRARAGVCWEGMGGIASRAGWRVWRAHAPHKFAVLGGGEDRVGVKSVGGGGRRACHAGLGEAHAPHGPAPAGEAQGTHAYTRALTQAHARAWARARVVWARVRARVCARGLSESLSESPVSSIRVIGV